MNYAVWIVSRPGYQHSQCFHELTLSLFGALRDLGHDVRWYHGDNPQLNGRRAIVLGAHLAPRFGVEIPKDAIIYNTEQSGSPWFTPEYNALLANAEVHGKVWDFSGAKSRMTLQPVCVVRPGYHTNLLWSYLLTVSHQRADIDVGLVGSMNDRRAHVLQQCHELGLSVRHITGYGFVRDEMIARCKLILNVHYYPDAAHESVRTSYLMANRIPVLSEADRGHEADGCFVTTYDTIAREAAFLIRNPSLLDSCAQHGHDTIRKRPMVEQIRDKL